MSSDTPRVTVDTGTDSTRQRGRLRRAWDTLQDTISQPVETVTRRATLQATGGNVEDVDPPEDIDELVSLYETVGIIRASINTFVDDVIEPGVRVESPDERTVDYFMGGDNAPDGAPEGGFLSEAFVLDESRQPFERGLELAVRNKYVRGTVLVELLKANPDQADSLISGFSHIRPETVSARTYDNTIQLIDPDDIEKADELTRRGEAAAWIQFDENSILGRRDGLFKNRNSVPLSQNDVLKQALDQDIGGSDPEDGVFGESALRACKDDATEYQSIKRDLATSVKGKAWGLWTAQFNDYVLETDTHTEVVRWDDEDIQATEKEMNDLGPGSVLTTDAQIDLERHDGDVPDLTPILDHYVDDILSALPTPKYAIGHESNINQFVTERQETRYQQAIEAERDYQERSWEHAFRLVAERHPELTAEDLEVRIEPEEDESPVLSLETETVENIETFSKALSNLVGQGESPAAVFGPDTIRELVAMLPDDADVQQTIALGGGAGDADADADELDETDEDVLAQFERLMNDD